MGISSNTCINRTVRRSFTWPARTAISCASSADGSTTFPPIEFDPLVDRIREQYDFELHVGHVALVGRCRDHLVSEAVVHIPDGYLSPETCGAFGAAMVPVWVDRRRAGCARS